MAATPARVALSGRIARASGSFRSRATRSARPTISPACGPPTSLSPEKTTRSAPAARRSAGVGSWASPKADVSSSAPLPRSSTTSAPCAWARCGERGRRPGDSDEAGHREVATGGRGGPSPRGPRGAAPRSPRRGSGSSSRPRRAGRRPAGRSPGSGRRRRSRRARRARRRRPSGRRARRRGRARRRSCSRRGRPRRRSARRGAPRPRGTGDPGGRSPRSSSRKSGSRAAASAARMAASGQGARPRFVWTITPGRVDRRGWAGRRRRTRRAGRSPHRRDRLERPGGASGRQPLPLLVDRPRAAATSASCSRSPARGRATASSRSTLGGRGPAGAHAGMIAGLAGAHGSRTHPAASGATAPVLKTGEPTGTQPLPWQGW